MFYFQGGELLGEVPFHFCNLNALRLLDVGLFY